MVGRTYRYFEGLTLYPFGYGLSYTTFTYSELRTPDTLTPGEDLVLQVTVTNTGEVTADEVSVTRSFVLTGERAEGFLRVYNFKSSVRNQGNFRNDEDKDDGDGDNYDD